MGLPPGQLANVANTKQQIAVPSFSVRRVRARAWTLCALFLGGERLLSSGCPTQLPCPSETVNDANELGRGNVERPRQ